jgi:m7GpppX diphosphatase
VGGDRSAWRGCDLYLLGLCHRRDVASLRDLRAHHLPMLRGMRDAALALIQSVYGLPPDQVRKPRMLLLCAR